MIHTRGLRKRYSGRVALDGLDLDVAAGTVHGLLGPNGAGKTTAVRILTTLLRPDGGTAEVAGHDVRSRPDAVRAAIGLVGQHAAVDEVLTGRQNLVMFGRLHHLGAARARARADELLDRFDLTGAGATPLAAYSGGMRRRLDLAAGMIRAPKVLFLDEPTTGLDPRGRTEVWAAVRSLVADGTTVLLTTQYLEEADQLAGRISVVDAGRVVADGSPDELKSALGGDRLDVVAADPAGVPAVRAVLAAHGEPEVDADERRVSVRVADRVAALTRAAADLDAAGVAVHDIALRRPTLDEVFLDLTAKEHA
ncbi:ATP-binding cassette domain-containing protein [Spirilliplanes yamanashiensis]|uniref:Daunorubicin resistance protein DrrA family ABC transporter ATP-binding protein n=1 Tax=Spirilliplanes yamanashiensis TaxID=42233 RepID=A0A8J4DJC5_9ACTN|nr:ATP-binding cassette domain-containing protein [Spirilliplanes yamanashiensis]MDP9817497.1 ABC-2 type transport system ATP-binding protein [Spirilliplanes yamanashiensis]GIJ02850.1 daunorubicin resistance protein DrrA family ABC transporter ATP-binding protein [Spirilliplanes yamanashiensis]